MAAERLWTYMQQIQEAQIGHHLDEKWASAEGISHFLLHQVSYQVSQTLVEVSLPAQEWCSFFYGIPDEIFTLADGTQCVIDHKTAMNKGTGDPFLPIYKLADNWYADIAQNGWAWAR